MEILDPPLDDGADRPTCEHGPATAADPRSAGCEECGSRINLRSCAHCGHVGCCESQAGHARGHALADAHPVIEQITRDGLGWAWCYEENSYVR